MAKKAVKTYYLYNLCNIEHNELAQNSAKNIADLLENKYLRETVKCVHIINQIEDIFE